MANARITGWPAANGGGVLDTAYRFAVEKAANTEAEQATPAQTMALLLTALTDLPAVRLRGYRETRSTPTITAGASTVDYSAGNVAVITLTGNLTALSITNIPASGIVGSLTLWLVQDATTGGKTVTWPASFDFGDAGTPTLASGVSQETIITILTRDGGTTWKASLGWKKA